VRRPLSFRSLLLLAGALLVAPGCTPTCEQVCDKLVGCDGLSTERQTAAECTETCQTQQELYQRWTDTELRADFDGQLSCLNDATCEQIAAGECFDAELYAWSSDTAE